LSLNRRYGIKNCIQICREIVSLICAWCLPFLSY
jgi:hypothetical protein